jgi:aldehyde dehydrogenase (NAD+)
MQDYHQFYINGEWVDAAGQQMLDVINPATEEPVARIALGDASDVDKAVSAAKSAFPGFSRSTRVERIALLERVIEVHMRRLEDMAQAISMEMGAPLTLAREAQAPSGVQHLQAALEALQIFEFEETLGSAIVFKEPVGVCGLITPWNWPANQISCKVAPALATGCTMVLKPSEVAPLSAIVWAEIMHEAGVPAGVFNLVNGDGMGVGVALSSHPDVDMMSFTGSTRAGISVAKCAADTVKRVSQELGGKSANIILPSANLEEAVTAGIMQCMHNSGQSCNAPTRMLVPAEMMPQVIQIAEAVAPTISVGSPSDESVFMGPVVSEAQFNKIQGLIQAGIDEGATLVFGGMGKPEGLETGYYVKPTVFANVAHDMTISREEIFGPVLSILGYETVADAISMANDTVYGLSGYVQGELEEARQVARSLRTGMVHINGTSLESAAPFGGYKQSGNGREWGVYGLEEFLESKAVTGYNS